MNPLRAIYTYVLKREVEESANDLCLELPQTLASWKSFEEIRETLDRIIILDCERNKKPIPKWWSDKQPKQN